jgi:hypothetical protein
VLAGLRVPGDGWSQRGHADGGGLAGLPRFTNPSTLRSYAAHVPLYLAPYPGPVLLGELSAAHVQAMISAIIRRHQAPGTPISAATLSRIRATLRGG